MVAVGAVSEPAFRRVLTWTPERDEEVFGGLLRDLEEGYTKRVAFVVPLGVAWPLPAYELALMTAWDARDMGQDDVRVTVYTPESAPLEIFGAAATAALLEDLEEAGVDVHDRRARHPVPAGPAWSSSPADSRSTPSASSRSRARSVRGSRRLANDTRGFIRTDAARQGLRHRERVGGR